MSTLSYAVRDSTTMLRRNLLVYGVGGVLAPFLAIKAIDLLVNVLHLA